MWLHESESNSLIRQACKIKIFLTIIYISYNSRAFNQEKALVGAFSVIVQPVVEPMDRFTAL